MLDAFWHCVSNRFSCKRLFNTVSVTLLSRISYIILINHQHIFCFHFVEEELKLLKVKNFLQVTFLSHIVAEPKTDPNQSDSKLVLSPAFIPFRLSLDQQDNPKNYYITQGKIQKKFIRCFYRLEQGNS